MVSGQLPPRKIAHRLGLWFGSRSGLVLVLGDNPTITPKENCPQVRLGFGLGLVLGWGNFPWGQLSQNPPKINGVKKTLIKNHLRENGETPHFISIIKLQNLISKISVPPTQKQPFADVSQNRYYIHRKAPVLKSLFNKLY